MRRTGPVPPRLADIFLERYCPPRLLEEIQGDLHELFHKRVARAGARAARLRYWWDVVRFVRPYFIRRRRREPRPGGTAMLGNYVTSAFRHLRRQAGYTFVNVAGLAVGMACCLLILLYVRDELRYDRFHEHAERIYRLRVERYASGGEAELTSTAAAPMAPAALADLPEVEQAVRISRRTYLVERGDRRFYEERFFWADSSFFDVFTFPLQRGDPATALKAPYAVVLTEAAARKYFGEADPLGQTLHFEGLDLTVTGVAADPPAQSHFTFDFLGSFATLEAEAGEPSAAWNWWSLNYHTYFLLDARASATEVQARLREMPARYVGDQEASSGYRQFLYLQPLTDIHLHSHYQYEIEPNGDEAYVYVFSAIALFILVLACINFTNLTTARSVRRAREVSVRKVVGAGRLQLVVQFLAESTLLALFAVACSVLLLRAVLPAFNDLAAKSLALGDVPAGAFVAGLFAFAVAVGLLSGLYPAFVLSHFRPVEVLKGTSRIGRSGVFLRKGLVVFQFAVSAGLIVGALAVYQQLRYLQTKNLGFEKEQVVVLNAYHSPAVSGASEAFKRELKGIAAVREVAFTSSIPGRPTGTNVMSRRRGMNEAGQTLSMVAVDPDFVETYGLVLAAGRDLSPAYATDSTAAFLINEAAMRALGWTTPEQAVGQELTRQYSDTRQVVGVVRDFHFHAAQQAIEPLVFFVRPQWFGFVSLRLDTDDVAGALAEVERVWKAFVPERPFDYVFLDADYDRQYRTEERVGTVVALFTGLALFIACLGLFALVSFTAEQRTKEIGVRKVLGASAAQIFVLLSKDFVRLVALAFVLAAPVAYFALHHWLERFAYRISVSAGLFLAAGVATLLVALLTVSLRTIRAALVDPVDALRQD